MKTKIALNIDGVESFVDSTCIKNWNEIACTFRRSDFSGVVRSFTNKFEFANEAADLLLDAYFANDFKADVKVSVWTMGNNLQYVKQFESPLDFSTMQRSNGVLTIQAIDNSVAAKIKANKSVKYELDQNELTADRNFEFDRVEMSEYATYELTQGESGDDGSIIISHNDSEGDRIWVGNVAHETSVGGSILYNEDQTTDAGSYVLKAYKRVVVNLEVSLDIDKRQSYGTSYRVYASVKNPRTFGYSRNYELVEFGGEFHYLNKGEYSSESALPVVSSQDMLDNAYATIGNIVWVVTREGENYGWRCTNQTADEYFKQHWGNHKTIELLEGEQLVIRVQNTSSTIDYCRVRVWSSRFHFTWKSRGDQVSVPCHSPSVVLNTLLSKMCEDIDTEIVGIISDHDARIARTVLVAAERLRNFPNPRFYSSFAEFCNWMETVFGYTYCIKEYDSDYVEVRFMHRSEIFPNSGARRRMNLAKELTHTINPAEIYSSIEVGYEKKDYDSINGRDEFNFSHTYTTGYSITDKKLTLLSKYRADCYGIEFAVQKREKTTTDSDSDNDVFFVYVGADGKPDRSDTIAGALTNTVFNAKFAPMYCVHANEGFIGKQSNGSMPLTFTSSTGNSDISIGGVAVTSNINLGARLLTVDELQFTTSEFDEVDPTDIIIVNSDGILYEGFLKEVEQKYAMEESYTYKILIKNIRRI